MFRCVCVWLSKRLLPSASPTLDFGVQRPCCGLLSLCQHNTICATLIPQQHTQHTYGIDCGRVFYIVKAASVAPPPPTKSNCYGHEPCACATRVWATCRFSFDEFPTKFVYCQVAENSHSGTMHTRWKIQFYRTWILNIRPMPTEPFRTGVRRKRMIDRQISISFWMYSHAARDELSAWRWIILSQHRTHTLVPGCRLVWRVLYAFGPIQMAVVTAHAYR